MSKRYFLQLKNQYICDGIISFVMIHDEENAFL